MNYTITFNPAIDLVVQAQSIALGELNRVDQTAYVMGGKGINMSTILNELGSKTQATGFVGGFTGDYIKQQLNQANIDHHFINVQEPTRINVKIKAEEETEINAPGPNITSKDFDALYQYLDSVVTEEDAIFLAGNAAPGLDASHYQAIAKLAQDKGAKFVLDSNKDLLTACLAYKPFLIKPNQHELSEIFGIEINTIKDIIYYANQLQLRGAQNVLVSLGGAGSFLLTPTGDIYQANVPQGTVINSVGAGDSMVAGFMAKYNESDDPALSLQQGAACGSATAFSVGIAKRDHIEDLKQQIKVVKL